MFSSMLIAKTLPVGPLNTLPLLDAGQPCLPELLDEVFVNLSISLFLLPLVFTQSIAGVLIAVAWNTSEDGPETDRDRTVMTDVYIHQQLSTLRLKECVTCTACVKRPA